MYRQYEAPGKLQKQLERVKEQLVETPDDYDLYLEKYELEDRIRFAWDDDEYDSNYAREHWRDDPECGDY